MISRVLLALIALAGLATGQTYVNGNLVSGAGAPLDFLATGTYTIVNQWPNPQGSSYSNGIAYYAGNVWCAGGSGQIFRCDPVTGNVLGSFAAPGSTTRELVHDGTSLWATVWTTKDCFELDPLSGAIKSSFNTGFPTGHPNGVTLDGNLLIISDEENSVHWFSKTGVWQKSLGLPLVPGDTSYAPRGLALDGTFLYAGYQSNKIVIKYDVTTGTEIERYNSPSGVQFQQGVALGDNHNIWITGGTNATVYEISFVAYWKDLGNALAGSTLPDLEGIGTLAGGTQADLNLTSALPGSVAGLVLGLSAANVPFYGGVLVPAPTVLLLGIPTGPVGEVKLSGLVPSPMPPGISVYAQYWIADPSAPFGYSASNGVTQTTP